MTLTELLIPSPARRIVNVISFDCVTKLIVLFIAYDNDV